MASLFYFLNDLVQGIRGTNTTFLTDKEVPGADLTGKWIIITGANNGIGFEAAKSFATWAAAKVCNEIAQAHGHSSTIEWWPLDMGDFETVEAFAQRWIATENPLDILCNNAGIAVAPLDAKTKDGFHPVHQINYLSHVLLTLRLLPSLAEQTPGRIVCTTSCYHHLGTYNADLDSSATLPGNQYRDNKLYYQMWLTELQLRLLRHPSYKGITVNGVNPGFVSSSIWTAVKAEGGRSLQFLLSYVAINPQQGSLAITYAATSPEFGPDPKTQGIGAPNGRGGGKYINRIWDAAPKRHVNDPELRSQVWIKTAEKLKLSEKGLLDVLGL
ncbi:Short-chain dehydrogenase/reductase SDR [Penicillium cosmopolitanum]|uniref:Short-chain dehydrogenase/reductase SDR n=1 Tax=Penicillium cosmopolitanum TaxID=1131564 RepID=A0A9X0B2Q4_9EURO|nr:Short-chain dehydrogenase/reductase SDR [Penicillium cosmopolitanum]KAJ5385955.1 Short-chain dehydrogenase/reductase SDR [Penicillium cosmopolitanum]